MLDVFIHSYTHTHRGIFKKVLENLFKVQVLSPFLNNFIPELQYAKNKTKIPLKNDVWFFFCLKIILIANFLW